MRTVIGVMGSGRPLDHDAEEVAYRLGRLVAEHGWVLLNGGRACGVMEASAKGAHDAEGLVVGVLPDSDTRDTSEYVDVPVLTGMGEARNAINVISSTVVIALPGGAGTISEVALALQAGRTVIAVDFELGDVFREFRDRGRLLHVSTPEEAVAEVRALLKARA